MKKYILDSNVFIMSARQYYAFDIVPTYWINLLKNASQNKNIVLLDLVKNEIDVGADALKAWISDHEKEFIFCNHKTDKNIINNYMQVLNYIQTCGLYTLKGLTQWASESIADPWLIAAAKANDFVVVTDERPIGKLSMKSPVGSIRIPDVASYFNVTTISLFDMMRELEIKI